jgi:hypothetical protein
MMISNLDTWSCSDQVSLIAVGATLTVDKPAGNALRHFGDFGVVNAGNGRRGTVD